MAWRWRGYILRLRDCETCLFCRLIRTGFAIIRMPPIPTVRNLDTL
jgi:hypothetical protein